MIEPTARLIIIAGGPGAGKSVLLDELQARGYHGMEECARAIIRQQNQIGGQALPWIDPRLFGELLLSWHIRNYEAGLGRKATVFFDRGVVDTVGYHTVNNLAVPSYVYAAVQKFRYHTSVLLAPPWLEIYRTDEERTETFEEGKRVFDHMVRAYQEAGYELIPLPFTSISERARFVIDWLEHRTFK